MDVEIQFLRYLGWFKTKRMIVHNTLWQSDIKVNGDCEEGKQIVKCGVNEESVCGCVWDGYRNTIVSHSSK